MKIRTFKSGEKIQTQLLVAKVSKGVATNGAPYLSVSFQDNSGSIEAKIWNVSEVQEQIIQVGLVVDVGADVLTYRNNLQLKVFKVEPLDQKHIELDHFVVSSQYDVPFLKEKISSYVEMIENPTIKLLVQKNLEEVGEQFYQYPAATRNHHDFVSGLAVHVYGMAELAIKLCDQYPIYNLDLLLAGCILHDMGKIEEYSSSMLPEYTTLGKMVGHISIMHANFMRIACELNLQDAEETMLLRHMILSHHGQMDFGSPVVPLFKEAEMLNFIDNIDARTNMFEKLYQDQAEGEFSSRMFALNNRSFYKAKGIK